MNRTLGKKMGDRGTVARKRPPQSAPPPPLITHRKNVECVFDNAVERLAQEACIGLDRDQKLLAKLFLMHVASGIDSNDPMFMGLSDRLFKQYRIDLTCRRVLHACRQGVQFQEFIPRFGIKQGRKREPMVLRGHGVAGNGASVVIPFERLFGKDWSLSIVRYLVKYMGRPPHQWPNFVAKGEKKTIWDSYVAS